ncbi:MAG: ATP-binding protein, partial [Gammaproteobacteria bacterium]
QCIDRQKTEIERNTRQFIDHRPANHTLLWGPRGTGKSSLIKAVFNAFASEGLRLIEIGKQDLGDLPRIYDRIFNRPERFILYCDDLSFEADDSAYKILKIAIDGSMSSVPDNALIYATSNRRHLMPEYLDENLRARSVEGEIHQTEGVEEKIALSERFGLWLAFHPFEQEEYLKIVFYWLASFGAVVTDHELVRQEALRWALLRGSRSGRAAYQFARDWAGRCGLERKG